MLTNVATASLELTRADSADVTGLACYCLQNIADRPDARQDICRDAPWVQQRVEHLVAWSLAPATVVVGDGLWCVRRHGDDAVWGCVVVWRNPRSQHAPTHRSGIALPLRSWGKGYVLEMLHALRAGGDELLAAAQSPAVDAVQRVRQPAALRLTPLELLSLVVDEDASAPPPASRSRPGSSGCASCLQSVWSRRRGDIAVDASRRELMRQAA